MKKCVDLSSYLGKTVRLVIDRPLGSAHPRYPGLIVVSYYACLCEFDSGVNLFTSIDSEQFVCYTEGERR